MTVTRTAAQGRARRGDFLREAAQDRPDLQAHQDEGEHVQHEHGRLPHRIGADAVACRYLARRRARDRHGVDDDGDDGGQPGVLREHPDAEGADELQDVRCSRHRARAL